MIERDIAPALLTAAGQFPALTLTGPRQSGKTTLCRRLFPHLPYQNLEYPDVRERAENDPRGFLAGIIDGAVIDEIQNVPGLLSYLQPLIDQNPRPGRWILTGSHNLALLQSVQQSLAGRTAVHELLPLTRAEIARFGDRPRDLLESILAGGYPAPFDRSIETTEWYRAYVRTYLERDVRAVRAITDLSDYRRFVQMCAGRTGQLLNFSALANDIGISQQTAKAWFSLLEATYIAFALPAFRANIRKRLTKAPKLHFFDTGLACYLLGIRTREQLRTHPSIGAIFETWVVSEIRKQRTNQGYEPGLFHYRESNGVEADLVVEEPGQLTLIECKSAATLSARHAARTNLVARHLEGSKDRIDTFIAYGGEASYTDRGVAVTSWANLTDAGFGGADVRGPG